MLIALLWLFLCVVLSLLDFTGRLNKPSSLLLIFPIGFGLLAITQFVIQWHFHFRRFEEFGAPDPMVYVQDALGSTRSTLMICAAAGVSFIIAILRLWLPRKTKLENKSALGNRDNAGKFSENL